MKRESFVSIAVLIALWVAWVPTCQAQRALVVVRHADKIDNSDDAALSPAGEAQAKRLAHVLQDLGITAIFTTQFKRTAQTAQPLAERLNIKPTVYEQKDVEGVVREIRRRHSGEAVMVVGHRSTVPQVLRHFGSTANVTLESGEYDSLFILSFARGRNPALLHLRF